jgi:hypothetical protein
LSFCHITLLLFLAFGRRMILYVSVKLVIAPRTVTKILRKLYSQRNNFVSNLIFLPHYFVAPSHLRSMYVSIHLGQARRRASYCDKNPSQLQCSLK